jgi:hypothetical protein
MIKKSSTTFLQIVIALFGMGVLAFLLWEPTAEGVNKNATTLREIYFDDPFLAYMYLGSVPFFVGLYKAIRVLGYIGQNNVFSQPAVNALRTIKYCALITAGAIFAAIAFLAIHARLYPEVGAQDGPEGAVMLGVVATFACIIVATAAGISQRILQKAVDIKSENDLTV